MNYPFSPDEHGMCRVRAHKPGAVWILVAIIGIILGSAALVAGLSTDTRDFASRHATVLTRTAL